MKGKKGRKWRWRRRRWERSKGTNKLTSMRFPSPDPGRLQMMAADPKTRRVRVMHAVATKLEA